MKPNRKVKASPVAVKRLVLLNRYYRITRFYEFIRDTSIKGGVIMALAVAVLVALEYFVLDFDVLLNTLVETYSPAVVFSTFFASETFLGLLPPEVFIAWSAKASTPWTFLMILASLSYLGGILAYFIGNRITMIPTIRIHLETKIKTHITNLKKWGGLFVFIGAMLPLPHSIVSMACGLVKYNFGSYLLWALFRFVRFIIYGLLIFRIF
ncbi:YqaA family protein [Mangrovibacterium diazotrophicum]|uniref:Membrane protein YqaA with SNARE-associated domain n=1 Tax=Mangrovibacterium diazotrophicum TaxID=1261403 RepID=A0A419VYY9_9BACT|nr:VTT domain-containing protein [Mangrovibacterium diazotrophicum]RKD88455.1 membrane protein YqaA with SNARE-associated domain [Mangrovibacterium diazotrophicum]